ncbi:7-carboxy-7-deazaguanine synthase QueE [Phaeobacter sp. HF9A]|uniref:7-carboxy-7-deazaguanine synthase QueE n=1 Tax=Phaeobacter sp. HF9A TaxID=2721561 RepID=UPI001430CA25|nr:7-carboxy-7-deazaguanine synthase QueE [Phaeobacter sp. HF9A]NIZ15496.1 7-carboxy-7-deazaguanine synthase QueE [Phaeobacter sp. HF9A]
MTLRIAEIFGPTLQGEGVLIGEPTVFVRAGGCDYRCKWCDSLHAVDSAYRDTWAPMTATEIMAEVRRLSDGQPLTVSISGGNPAIQDFAPLIALGKAEGYRFALETQGSIAQDWFAALDTLVLSPKPPSSGHRTDWLKFERCLTAVGDAAQTVLKIVIFDQNDLAYARATAARYPQLPLFLQPGNPEVDPSQPVDLEQASSRLRWLIDNTVGKGWFAPRILPQLHVLVWGNMRGV